MFIILFRTVLIYIFLIGTMRLMGKRQLGELEVTDLVITLLLSEIATIPITDKSTPLLYAIVPVVTLASFEVFTSGLTLKYPKLKKFLSPKPAVLIRNGKADRREMQKVRISLDELLSELRQKSISDINQVDYAILESNGKISIITKAAYTPPVANQFGMAPQECGIQHIIFCDGVYSDQTLQALGKDRIWVQEKMKEHGLSPDQVFYMIADDLGGVVVERRKS
ncbi:MAG: DUF421 domain-containing protein [Clostridia bacterium]|nr:DUF421 domain-containing protein [Clostridia bacterium]